MSVKFNHTIIHAKDQVASARFLAELLGLPEPTRFGHFHVVKLTDGASLDYMTTQDAISAQHYAFLVTEEVFESLIAKIRDRKIQHWADPFGRQENQINTHDGGRGVYFQDPNGHYMEAITVPYGGW